MKNVLTILLVVFTLVATAQDKKEMKRIVKDHGEFAQGKVFDKPSTVALLGTNLRFRVAARATASTSNKDDIQAKFQSFAVLDSVPESVFQEITDEYNAMVRKRFEDLGFTVTDQADVKKVKSYAKLAEKGTAEKQNVVKSWGVANIYCPNGQDYVTYNGIKGPLGPHAKVARELKAVLYSSLTTVDFCFIEMDADGNIGDNPYANQYIEGNAKVTPAISIHGYTYPLSGVKMLEDATYTFATNDKGKYHNTMYKGMIVSDLSYSARTEKCSDCQPEFARKANLFAHGMGTVVITADPEMYKKAVLDALTKYLDEVFMLYTAK